MNAAPALGGTASVLGIKSQFIFPVLVFIGGKDCETSDPSDGDVCLC